MPSQRSVIGAVMLGTVAIGACSSSDSTAPAASNRVSLGFQIARSTAASSLMSSSMAWDGAASVGLQVQSASANVTTTAAGLMIARQSDTIVVTKAQFVVSDVRLRSVIGACADAAKSSSNDKKNDFSECPEIRVGPFLVDIPVTGEDGARISVNVPAGTYGNVRIKLHKVDANNALDLPFQQQNPDFRNISVRLEGTYNRVPFVFTNDLTTMINVPLVKPLVIKTGGDQITVSVDIAAWFVRASGGLYSPALANTPGSIRGTVSANIERAFRAFRDQNLDGRED